MKGVYSSEQYQITQFLPDTSKNKRRGSKYAVNEKRMLVMQNKPPSHATAQTTHVYYINYNIYIYYMQKSPDLFDINGLHF